MATRKTAAKAAKPTTEQPAAEPDKPSSEPTAGEPGQQPDAAEGAALLATGGDFTPPPIVANKLSDEELAALQPGKLMVLQDARPAVIAGVESIARVCHEANAAICAAFGDDSQKPWAEAADWQRESAIKGVEFALANPDADPEAQHNAWCRDKIAAGWGYGPVKDEQDKRHPCLTAYANLPPQQKAKDHVFRAIVRAMTAG